MLIERYNQKTNEYECFDDNLKYIVFLGFGKTKEEARSAYFLTQIIKNPIGIINFNVKA